MAVKLAVQKEHIISLGLSAFDIRILSLDISSIKEHHFLILVSLGRLYSLPIVLYAVILALSILQKGKLHGPVTELLIGKHAIFNEQFEIVPLALQSLTLILEYVLKPVSNLLGNVSRYLLHIRIALQIAP